MNQRILLVAAWIAISPKCVRSDEAEVDRPELVEARRIWDQAPHNAFTDLLRHEETTFNYLANVRL